MAHFFFIDMNLYAYFFISCLAAAALFLLGDEWNWSYPFLLRNYFMDVLCMPIVFGIIHYSLRLIKPHFKLTLSMMIVLTLMYVIYFEVILPPLSPRYTFDGWDIVAYILGASISFIVQRYTFLNKKTVL
ncbi:hypothetical protein RBU60_00850 [Mesonia sp. MT50]|uniref:Magnesium citrate secondary transporter n=2 Tax=Mesonia TaxID=232115 RepID=A0ABU0ZXE3_9FLAO|nr:hypothetical protein [Mesonia profundi]MDQ7916111.1 hypothetical protein [Mesonia profundi]